RQPQVSRAGGDGIFVGQPRGGTYCSYPAVTEPTEGALSVGLGFYGGVWALADAHCRLRLGAGAGGGGPAGRLGSAATGGGGRGVTKLGQGNVSGKERRFDRAPQVGPELTGFRVRRRDVSSARASEAGLPSVGAGASSSAREAEPETA